MPELNFYDNIFSIFVKELKAFLPTKDDGTQIPIRPENFTGEIPDYPYITINFVTDYTPQTFGDVENEKIQLVVDFKAVSDNENVAKSLGMLLRKLFVKQQPLWDMSQAGIVATGQIQALPSTSNFIDDGWQFDAGATYTFVTNDNFIDKTQPGTIEKVDPQTNFESGEN